MWVNLIVAASGVAVGVGATLLWIAYKFRNFWG